MKRLLAVPAVVVPVLAVAWVRGFVWPVAVTVYSVLGRRSALGPDEEADVFG